MQSLFFSHRKEQPASKICITTASLEALQTLILMITHSQWHYDWHQKKVICQILFCKLSSLTGVYFRESSQRLCARGTRWSIIYSSKTQKPLKMKNLFAWTNSWIISGWELFVCGLLTSEKERARFVGLFSAMLDLPSTSYCPCNFPIIVAVIFCLPRMVLVHASSTVNSSRSLAWVRIPCGKTISKRSDPPVISRQGPFIFKLLIKGRAHHQQPPPTYLTNLTVKLDPSHLARICLWCSSRP